MGVSEEAPRSATHGDEADDEVVEGSAQFELNAAAPEFVPRHGSRRSSGAAVSSTASNGSRGQSRRSTGAIEAPGQVATLVVKNLGLDLNKESLVEFLKGKSAPAMAVELHLDTSGAFRGTAFIRYGTAAEAAAALEKLGTSADFGGRKVRIEIQKSKSLLGRRSLEAELSEEDLELVRAEIERFMLDDSLTEMRLSPTLSVQQRKYAHSLAERHCLNHVTSQGDGGEKHVLLSKARRLGWHQDLATASAARPRASTALPVTACASTGSSTVQAVASENSSSGRRRKARAGSASAASAALWPGSEMLWSPASAPTPVVGLSPGLGPWMPPPAWGPHGFMLPPPGLCGWGDGSAEALAAAAAAAAAAAVAAGASWPADAETIAAAHAAAAKAAAAVESERQAAAKAEAAAAAGVSGAACGGDGTEGSTEATDGVTEDEQQTPLVGAKTAGAVSRARSLQEASSSSAASIAPGRRRPLSAIFRHLPYICGGQS